MNKLIIDFFKNNDGTRITNGDKWMVYETTTNEWTVYEAKRYAKKSTRLITTENLRIALGFLKGE